MIGLASAPGVRLGERPARCEFIVRIVCADALGGSLFVLLLDVLGWAGHYAGDFGSPRDDLRAGVLVGTWPAMRTGPPVWRRALAIASAIGRVWPSSPRPWPSLALNTSYPPA